MEEALSHTGILQVFVSLQWLLLFIYLFFLSLTPAWAQLPHSH